ncbi:TPA: oligosaccharide flippase family protein [Vibrio diabolicus]|uniref:oligosaccharide flippase family protein n=1 Tax=Vibrio diabolicus TaxID=50719 RepID=UPI00215FB843|nr:oligosaccharide flippase family protein [Vibrio diabolicus]ELH9640285.1 oligosaccharide flippase family protein [Vibrio alginolyticus]MCS0396680.1 oligosaccharide flippase family protein [Vibrio diabolicus]
MSLGILKNKLFKNSAWLILDKFYVLFCGLIVSTIVARHLGPEELGVLNFGITLSMICVAISQWGASFIIFNTASRDEVLAVKYIKDTYFIRLALYLFTCLILYSYLSITLEQSKALMITLICLSNIFLGLDIYQFYFNGCLSSKTNAKAGMIAKSITMIIRLSFVSLGLGLEWFIIPLIVEGAIIVWKKHRELPVFLVEHELENKTKEYIRKGTPFLISTFFVVVYTKSNEILLQEFSTFKDIGLYSAGMLLANAWAFIPMAIGTSVLSEAIKNRNTEQFSFCYFIVFMVSVLPIVLMILFSEEIVDIVFGEEYLGVTRILPILSISSLFGVLVFLINRQIGSYENGGKYILIKNSITTVIAISLSYHFISKYGLIGAAYSLMLTQLINMTLANYFFKNVSIFRIHTNIFNLPMNYRSFKHMFLNM